MSILKKIYKRFVFLLFIVWTNLSIAQIQNLPEYQLKAVYLYNFTQFITWPSSSYESPQSPYIIGIYGSDPFENFLKEIISGENVNGHPVIIKYFNSYEEIKNCQILFVNKGFVDKISKDLNKLKERNILTISDAGNFLEQDGMIGFYNKDKKVLFRINLHAVKSTNLEISSKLLRVSEIYNPKK